MRALTLVVWLFVGAWAAFALIRLFGVEGDSGLVPVVAFTPWIALAALIPVGLAAAVRNWPALATAAAAAVVLAVLVLPRAFGGPTSATGEPGPSLRVLAANVEFGEARADELVALARELDADALAVAELTPRFAAALRRAGVNDLLPHSLLAAAPRADGTGLYSRLPLAAPKRGRLPGGFAFVHAEVRAPAAQAVDLVAVHTAPPTALESWGDDLETLPAGGGAVPPVLAGDFNATLDHAEFREVLDRGYADAADTLGEGLTPTWPADRRLPPLVAIDHVLADQRIGIREFSAHDVDGTDHRAVFAELQLPAEPAPPSGR
jgi:endonuclease/exonuclease/phosphatase family metal-dependent hydrolase